MERRRRLRLTKSRRRYRFERRMWMWLWGMGVPLFVLTVALLRQLNFRIEILVLALIALLSAWAFTISLVMDGITHPLHTLANVVAALRMDDFSFRARGGSRNDAIGDLAMELNKLADMLQAQRTESLEALALADRVIDAMQSPLVAVDPSGRVSMINGAAERAFSLSAENSLGRTVEELGLSKALKGDVESAESRERWMAVQSSFRMRGIPHTLFVLSDIGVALRAEERAAWERLVRVLGHEINNSLTPIKSIAGSLRQRVPVTDNDDWDREDFRIGLEVIENRAGSLNRFLKAYQQTLQVPLPVLANTSIEDLMQRVALLETRLPLHLSGEDVNLFVDGDQIQQAMINLVRNAVDAAMSLDALSVPPVVEVCWAISQNEFTLKILDSGPGLSNSENLFVPFYTTKEGGTGIGLVLAQQIVNAHRGTLTLANRDDGRRGCMASVRLPLN